MMFYIKMNVLFLSALLVVLLAGCSNESGEQAPPAEFTGAEGEVKIMTLNPGHFHAALVHKYDYRQVDNRVHVYAPEGPELQNHLDLIEGFNTREQDPTDWQLEIYTGDDYLERMLEEQPGNVMVVAGDNARKIEYIDRAVGHGINVLADKPMVITPGGFATLEQALQQADEQGLVVNDIMTERHVAATRLQRELSQIPAFFGELRKGTPDDPAITKESVHYFSKTVAGSPLIRPAWFFDAGQQGEAIVDVSTHLVDMILWQSFPGEPIDYRSDSDSVQVLEARSWATELTPSQFSRVTGREDYPDYLQEHVEQDSLLQVAANGEFTFSARGVHGKVSVLWDYENPDGGDTHYSIMKGTRANLIIRQDEAQEFTPTLYAEPADGVGESAFEQALEQAVASLGERYEGLSAEQTQFGWKINIPDRYQEGHEEHFASVTEDYLQYLVDGQLPQWERTNLLTKYYITTRAFELSR